MLTSRGNRISIWIFVLVALISPQLFSQNIRFSAPLAIPFPSQRSYAPAALTTGDVNDDGNTDLLLFSQTFDSALPYNTQLTLLLGNGLGTFTASTLPITPHPFSQFLLADLNSDGKPDLLYIYGGYNTPPYPAYQGNVEVWIGNGKGGFTKAHSYPLPVGTITAELSDFNHDGKKDLVVLTANSIGGSVSGSDTYIDIFRNEGDGSLLRTQSIHHASAYEFLGPAADYNGDGDQDLILIASSNNAFTVLGGQGNGTFTIPAKVTYTFAGQLINSMASTDLNGDGKADLLVSLWPNTSAYPWRIATLLAKQTSGFYWAGSRNVAAGLTYLTLADLNGDGKLDDLDFNIDSGAVRVLPGEGGLNFGPAQYIYNGHWGGVMLAPLKTGELPSLFFLGTNGIVGPGYLGVMANISQ
jgi:hypothetical protein